MLKNLKVQVTEETNPFRIGSFKRVLMDWALKTQTFTKGQFVTACKELATEVGYESKMDEDTFPKAWWNEFVSKHKMFVPVDIETTTTTETDAS